jgi:biotin--protein ligase
MWAWPCPYPYPDVIADHHRNQEVTLTTVTPHIPLRILSITPDHGLLRCLPLARPSRTSSGLTPLYDREEQYDDDRGTVGRGGGQNKRAEEVYVDLQPDGNSFDLMSGLIKKKV